MRTFLVFIVLFCLSCKKSRGGGSSDSVPLPPAMEPTEVGRYLPTFDGDPRSSYIIDAHFIQYVVEFEEEWGMQVNTPISFSYLPKNLLGVCSRWEKDGQVLWDILIDKETFLEHEVLDPYLAKVTIFHELGHCEFQRYHDNRFSLDNGERIPYSIMNGSLLKGPFWEKLWEPHYSQEIFSRPGTLVPAGSFDEVRSWVRMRETWRHGFKGEHICN